MLIKNIFNKEFSRTQKAKLNIVFSILMQAVTIICGLIVPRLLLASFGSDAYGATASIAQFLSYIVLFEGGISGVARAALYKPLANKDWQQVSQILNEIRYFFRIVGLIFIIYTLIIACSFKYISHFEYYDWLATFILVVVISFSQLSQYFLGLTYYTLIQASQKGYIDKVITSVGILLNTICVIILVKMKASLISVKFVSSLVFLLQPLALYWYVKKNFPLVKTEKRDASALKQKWSGLSQHLAFFLHNNTDMTVLTVLTNLSWVAVYSVYNMIVSQIQNTALSFTQGMEALFGELLAKKENEDLNRIFDYYETLISCVSITLFTTTALVIVAFIKIYTQGISDAEYTQPLFAVLLTAAALVTCLRVPYHNLVIAAGHFKQTEFAAYGEAIINITLSILLVLHYGLIGVAAATLIAVSFRFIYYIFYISRNIMYREIKYAFKRGIINFFTVLCIGTIGYMFLKTQTIDSYLQWVFASAVITCVSGMITFISNFVFYRSEIKGLLKHLRKI